MSAEFEYKSFQKSPATTVVARLRQLAAQLEAGKLQPGEDSLPIPDALHMKIELEEKREGEDFHYEIEVELGWPVTRA